MKIGIGAPTMLPGTPGRRLAEWARAAEAAGFASLNVTDRMAYENYDPFAALAAAAAVTDTIPLRTSIVLGPLRSPGLLAKSALTLDRLSDGRFELGLGVGSRPDDYTAADVDIHRRGELLDAQVKKLLSVWQEAAALTPGAIGPEPVTPSGPKLMFGGSSAATWRRIAEFGASWMCGHGGPDIFRTSTAQLDKVWTESGRSGRPTRRMAVYFAVGDVGPGAVKTFIESYFGFAPFKEVLLKATPKSVDDVRGVVERYTAAGCDELVLFPCSGDLEQVDLLAGAVANEL